MINTLTCELCDTKDNVKISRRYNKTKYDEIITIDRPLCNKCIKFTEGYLRTIKELEDEEFIKNLPKLLDELL